MKNNIRGETTIERTGIDRHFLDERRRDKYQACKILYQLIHSPNIDRTTKNALQKLLNEAIQNSAEFASMIRCAIRDRFSSKINLGLLL